jgi:hypothetical protein
MRLKKQLSDRSVQNVPMTELPVNVPLPPVPEQPERVLGVLHSPTLRH